MGDREKGEVRCCCAGAIAAVKVDWTFRARIIRALDEFRERGRCIPLGRVLRRRRQRGNCKSEFWQSGAGSAPPLPPPLVMRDESRCKLKWELRDSSIPQILRVNSNIGIKVRCRGAVRTLEYLRYSDDIEIVRCTRFVLLEIVFRSQGLELKFSSTLLLSKH